MMNEVKMQQLKQLLGMDYHYVPGYPLPKIDEDSLTTQDAFGKYALAKKVLEHPVVNPVLESMSAFNTLNKFDVESYLSMANTVLHSLSLEEESTEFDAIVEGFGNTALDSVHLTEVDDCFKYEFIVEFSRNKFGASTPELDADDSIEAPAQGESWIKKILSKLGIKDVDFKDALYWYFINQYLHKDDPEPSSNMGMGKLMPSMGEGVIDIAESVPPEMEGWIKSVKDKFMEKYPDDHEEKLHSMVQGKYEDQITETDDASIKAEKTENRTAPKIPANVKKDVKQRVKELNDLIRNYNKKPHFQGEVRPAIFNAVESLEFILDKCGDNNVDGYFEAQLMFQKLKSPVVNLFPPSLVKYLSGATAD